MHEKQKLLSIYKTLYALFGPQKWWPADSAFEVIIGAILTQNTNWKNVEKAIYNLKLAKALNPKAILESRKSKLENWLRPSGYYRQKTKKLKIFIKHLLARYKGQLRLMFDKPINQLREELLSIYGIGPETADSILLYAAGKQSFVVDAYTRRIGNRVRLYQTNDYHEIKAYFEKNLPTRLEIYKEFHALLVELAKNYCRSTPLCKPCPLSKSCKFSRSNASS